jgi:hypothetical protein
MTTGIPNNALRLTGVPDAANDLTPSRFAFASHARAHARASTDVSSPSLGRHRHHQPHAHPPGARTFGRLPDDVDASGTSNHFRLRVEGSRSDSNSNSYLTRGLGNGCDLLDASPRIWVCLSLSLSAMHHWRPCI